MPVVSIHDGRPAPPEVFLELWKVLARDGWRAKDFAVVREHPAAGPCIASQQMLTTDTGPLLEVAPAPSTSLAGLAAQPAFAIYRNTVMKGCIDALQPCEEEIADKSDRQKRKNKKRGIKQHGILVKFVCYVFDQCTDTFEFSEFSHFKTDRKRFFDLHFHINRV